MVFSSSLFLFVFFPITVAIYYILDNRFKNMWLLIASLVFYSWGEPKYIALIILSICINFIFGLLIEICEKKNRKTFKRFVLIVALIADVAILAYFKYLDFIITNTNRLFGSNIALQNIALPIGISFYTFQIISYIIDIYRGENAQRNIFDLGLYISLFPQLIAGPIVRYADIRGQLRSRKHTVEKFYNGSILFMMGFSKKILIADQLSPLVDEIFSGEGYSAYAAWIGAIAYTLQIYYDFSGYSDMAIGLGNIFGFEFVQNFDYPYISASIREFWRRWHISLSTWFKDYVYIPLGGSRCSKLRLCLNLIVVFFLTGLWHGASWNFIIWGLYYVIFLILERIFLWKLLDKTPKVVMHIYTLSVIVIGWIFFRAPGMESAIHYIRNLFRINSSAWADIVSNMNKQYIFCLLAGILFSMPIGKKFVAICTADEAVLVGHMVSIVFIFIMFIIAISYMVGSGFSPFLYFRF